MALNKPITLIIVAAVAATAATATKNATGDHLLQTVMTSPAGGIAQLGGLVEVACRVLRPIDVVMVKLMKLPLSPESAAGQEVFTSGGGRQKLRSPWDTRPDLIFNGSNLTVRFNMSQSDEGRFRCDAVTLDGELPSGAKQLLTLQRPSAPSMLFDGVAAKPSDKLDIVIGDNLTVNCSANVGKPAGDIRIAFVAAGAGATEKDVPGTRNASWTGPISSENRTVSTIYKSTLVTVKIEDVHHGGSFVCRLTPSPLAASLSADGNKTADGNDTASAMEARGPIVNALFAVRNIRMEPFRENFFHGDYLDCLADGRPEPDIRWTRIQGVGPLMVNGTRLSMPPGAPPGYYSYTCSATNTVRGRSHQLLQSIGFNLHNRTAADALTPGGGNGSSGVGHKVKVWVTHHRRGLTVGLVIVGVLASLSLVGALLVCLCGNGGYRRLSGAKSTHHGSVRDRMRYYGELGETVVESSDEDEGDDGYHMGGGARQLLGGGGGKHNSTGVGENAAKGSEWNGTQV